MPFQSAACKQLWMTHVAPSLPDYVAHHGSWVVTEHRAAKGMLSYKRLRLAAWEYDWGQVVSEADAAEFLALPDALSWDIATIIWSGTENLRDPESGTVGTTPEAPRTLSPGLQRIAEAGYTTTSWPAGWEECLAEWPDDWDAYWGTRSSKLRCEVRRKFKHAAPLNPEWRALHTDPNRDACLDQLFDAHGRQWNASDPNRKPSVFETPAERSFYKAWSAAMVETQAQPQTPTDQLRLYGLFLAGELACLRFGVLRGDAFYSMLTINTGAHQAMSPGVLALQLEMETLHAEGCRLYHMGPGQSRYKKGLMTHVQPYYTTCLANPKSMRGRLMLGMKRRELSQAV